MPKKLEPVHYTVATKRIAEMIERLLATEAEAHDLNNYALRKCVVSWLQASLDYDDAMRHAADQDAKAHRYVRK